MNQRNYNIRSKNLQRNHFLTSPTFNQLFYIIFIIFLITLSIVLVISIYDYIQFKKREAQFIESRIDRRKKFMDQQFNEISNKEKSTKVTEVTIEGNKIPCEMLKPCRAMSPKPQYGCCPDGIRARETNNTKTDNCTIGADEHAKPSYQNALKECGY